MVSHRGMEFGKIYAAEPHFIEATPKEEILFPDLPIIDPHMHLWIVRGETNDVLSGTSERYMLEEYLADASSGHNIIGTVYSNGRIMWRIDGLEEHRVVGEVEFANGVAAMCASGLYGPCQVANGIVGSADLWLGDRIAPVLDASIIAGGGRFRGVRTAAGWDPHPAMHFRPLGKGLYVSDGFRAGLSHVFSRGLSFEALIFYTQLDDVIAMAREFPHASIILGHTGGVLGYGPYANRRDEIFKAWKAAMTRVAEYPNVSLKLGGMTLRSATLDYPSMNRPASSQEVADAWRPYIETSIELFGVERCMFESNFPVERMGIGFNAIWNAFKRITAGASEDERHALFADNARRIYRLTI